MNHVYRLVWNRSLNALVAVAENAGAGGKAGSPRQRRAGRVLGARLAPVARAVLLALGLSPAIALALPTGGRVVSGNARISSSGNTLTVTQTSGKAILDWQGFGIASGETVNFDQPGAGSVALNRVLGNNASDIYGHLNATGQVFLVNPNGIYFAPGAQVNVAGLVASTLGISDTDFNNGNYTFSGSSTAAVVNDGTIATPEGGYVAFIGHQVANDGTLATPGGTAALGAGGTVDLTLAGNRLLSFKVSSAALNALAENGGLIKANGGAVILSAEAKDALLKTVVNNTGVIQAQTVANHNGTIALLGGESGTTQVSGTLDASAPSTGDGGHIETSGAHLKVADGATITTQSASGDNGTWLIDPSDFTIAASGGDITGSALSADLASSSITIRTQATYGTNTATTQYGVHWGSGDINVDDPVSWSANTTLTLSAYRNINIQAAITASGSSGKLALAYGQGSTNGVIGGTAASYNVYAPVNLQAGSNFSTQLGSSGSTIQWTVITSLGSPGDATTAPGTMTLQGLAATGSAGGHYVLGADINASATATWNPDGVGGYHGFVPIGISGFGGGFDGLGHTVSHLYSNANVAGLFGHLTTTGVVRDVGLVDAQITGGGWTGALVGTNAGTLDNVYATGSVAGSTNVGGLVGSNASSGTISQAYAAVAVSGSSNDVGGLVGLNTGTISNAYATGSVTGTQQVGGLVGNNYGGTVTSAYTTGVVTGSALIGGFVGSNTGTVTDGYWDISTDTTSGITAIGGGSATGITGRATVDLAAQLPTGFSASVWANGGNRTTPYLLANAGATGIGGHVILGTDTGATPTYYDVILNANQLQDIGNLGLVGHYLLGRSFDASATAGWNGGAGFAPIGDSTNRFTGVFDGLGYTIGNLHIDRPSSSNIGLFGYASNSTIRNVGLVGGSVNGKSIVGELVGANYSGSISNAYATGVVSGSNNVGGLAGGNSGSGTITNAYASGAVSARTSTSNNAGGLVGNNSATISDAYATGAVSGAIRRGGLVGINNGGTVSNAYAIGSVAGGTNAGALVGYNYGGTITNGYWDTATSTTTGVGKNTGTITGGSGLTTAALAAALPSGFSSSTWANAGNQTTPYLLANASSATVGGHVILGTDASATPTGYDVIQTLTELQNINSTGLAGDYVLGNDIDASATASWNGGAGFIPIGGTSSNSASAYGTWSANPFTGTFDGLGHTISHLYINRPGAYISSAFTYLIPAAGLFGYTSSTSIVRNVGLLNADIHGSYRVGALVGSNAGAVTNAYATGDVTGYWYVGGLVGSNTGPITGSYATATVSGTVNAVGKGISLEIGGLVGASSNATITGSYATGAVSFSTNPTGYLNLYLGGLIGSDYQGTITGDYATGTVNAAYCSNVGGLIGIEQGGTITGDYATGAVTGSGSTGGLIGSYQSGNSGSGNTISDVYATGAVSANYGYLGGLIGGVSGTGGVYVTVRNAYATGSVSGLPTSNGVGGLVGVAGRGVIISDSYATGSVVAGASDVGGLVGRITGSNSTVSNGYWDTTTGLTVGIGANYGTMTGGGGLTTAQLAAALPTGFDSGVWANGGNQTTPYLLANASFSTVGGHVILGSDTSATPSYYDVIQTLTQLQDINSTGLGRDYVLGNDIDASATASWNSGAGFAPIGNASTAFTGVFDGLGFTVSGLTINRTSSNDVGLFGRLSSATVRDIGLVGGSVIGGSNYVGGLVGWSQNNSTINNAYATSSVQGTSQVGGLVGWNSNSTISNAYATGSVWGGLEVGGLVGWNSNSTISNAYATGSVRGGYAVGGLVGLNKNNSTITGAYATGTVIDMKAAAGGLVGSNSDGGTISNAYATGHVSGGGYGVGSLVGRNALGTISNVYATGTAGGSNLVGTNDSGTITNGYWDTTTGTTNGIGSNFGGTVTGGGGLTTAELAAALPVGFDSSVWANGGNQTTPYLLANASFSTVGGHVILGTTPAYYDVIQSMTQLQNINSTGLAGHYVLGTNLTDSTTTGSGFTPIGNGTTKFTGVFDGLNHTISNLYINRSGSNYVGLFGDVNGGTIRNIGLVGGSVTGKADVGALIGYILSGTISNAYATGSVSGSNVVGGLVGDNVGGTISDAYATGSVSGANTVGGLVGYNPSGTITDAYATGSVSGSSNIGGLVGYIASGTISNTYATGSVSGTDVVGGLVGDNVGGTVSDAYATGTVNGGSKAGGLVGSNGGTVSHGYWDTMTTGQGTSAGSASSNGLTSAQMQQSSSFTGFDFSTTWVQYDGHTNPLLRSFMTALTVTAGNVSKTYDGTAYSGGLSSPTYSVAGAAGSGHLLGLSTPYSGDVNAGSYSPGLYSDQQGYIIGYSGGTLTITPKALSASLTGNPTKTYDGTAAATLSSSDYTLSGFVSGQGATVTQTAGTYASPNAGSGIGVTTTLAGGDFSANSGTLLSNYVLPTAAAGTGTIDPKALSVSGVSATNKVYDGTAADNLDTTGATLSGVIGADNVSLGSGTAAGTFASPNVGSGIVVNAHLTLTGSAAGNYTVTAPTGLTSNITPKALSAAITGHPTKTYDGTVAATLTRGDYTLSGFVSGQGAAVTQTAGTYADANVGTRIKVTTTLNAGDFSADAGTLLSNYILPIGTTTGIGAILPASVATSTSTAERTMQGGYALPVSGPSLLLAPIGFAQLTQMPGKPSGVEVKASGRGVSPPARPCRSSASLDPYARSKGLCHE